MQKEKGGVKFVHYGNKGYKRKNGKEKKWMDKKKEERTQGKSLTKKVGKG